MKKFPTEFKRVAAAPAATVLALMISFNVAQAGSAHSIDFDGNNLNCATLQGARDPIPNGMTCGFVEEVEQYMVGPKLKCDRKADGRSSVSLRRAAQHLRDFHAQSGLFGYTEGMIATENSKRDGTNPLAELSKNDAAKGIEYYLIYAATEGVANRTGNGYSIPAAITETASQAEGAASRFEKKGHKMPWARGSVKGVLEDLFNGNRVLNAYLQCRKKFPKPIWNQYER